MPKIFVYGKEVKGKKQKIAKKMRPKELDMGCSQGCHRSQAEHNSDMRMSAKLPL